MISKPIVAGILFVLLAGAFSPPAAAWKTDNHPSIVEDAVAVLEADNYTYLVGYLTDSDYLDELKKGVIDCDSTQLAVNHYYNPITGKGVSGATPATTYTQAMFDEAVAVYESGDAERAWWTFGWSLHTVQDLFVPFHAALDPANGHSAFEAYAYQYRHDFGLPAAGIYDYSQNASQWVVYAASQSYPYYAAVSGVNATDMNFDTVISILYPEAVALSAGYIKFFADAIGLGDFNVFVVSRDISSVKIGWDESADENFSSYRIFVSEDPATILDDDPVFEIDARDITEREIFDLELFHDYYFQVVVVSSDGNHESNLLKSSPGYPLWMLLAIIGPICIMVPIMTFFIIRHDHRQRRQAA
jgi:phospholipase C